VAAGRPFPPPGASPGALGVVAWGIVKTLIILALLVAGGSLIFSRLADVSKDEVPVPSMVVVPNPPQVDFQPPNPLK
jgi:hypothetical protein